MLTLLQKKAMIRLKNHKRILNKQSFTSLKGQILSGDPLAAMRGLDTIKEKRKGSSQ